MATPILRGLAYEQWLAAQRKRREQIKAAYKREKSLAIVALRYGISRGRVSQIVNSES